MKNTLLLSILICGIIISASYDHARASENSETVVKEESDEDQKWNLGFRGGFNGSQASFRNWQGGGVSTISLTTSAVFDAEYRTGKWGYTHATNLRYGQAKIEDEYRKTDDQIAIRNQFRYFFNNEAWSALFDLNFQSQFDKGKDKDNLEVVSNFFSPAYLSQILGITYKPASYFNASFGVAMKQTFVSDSSLANRYGLRDGQSFKNETGASFLLNYKNEIMENVTLVSSMETFTGFLTGANETDYTFTNELNAKINSYLTTNFQFVMLYNSDVSNKVQLKQVLSVGLNYRFL